jgi:hypothetical protein
MQIAGISFQKGFQVLEMSNQCLEFGHRGVRQFATKPTVVLSRIAINAIPEFGQRSSSRILDHDGYGLCSFTQTIWTAFLLTYRRLTLLMGTRSGQISLTKGLFALKSVGCMGCGSICRSTPRRAFMSRSRSWMGLPLKSGEITRISMSLSVVAVPLAWEPNRLLTTYSPSGGMPYRARSSSLMSGLLVK